MKKFRKNILKAQKKVQKAKHPKPTFCFDCLMQTIEELNCMHIQKIDMKSIKFVSGSSVSTKSSNSIASNLSNNNFMIIVQEK